MRVERRSIAADAYGGPPRKAGMAVRLARLTLLVAMAVGSLALWVAVPLGWIWLASRVTSTNHFVFLATLACCPVTMVAVLRGLASLHEIYAGLGSRPKAHGRLPPAWRRSLRDESHPQRDRTILDVFLVVSAVIAVVALNIWFFLFSASPLESVQILGH
jgi:hypothetical protein